MVAWGELVFFNEVVISSLTMPYYMTSHSLVYEHPRLEPVGYLKTKEQRT